MMIGVPENDGRKDDQRRQPPEIKPKREQPSPQPGNADQPDQDRRPKKHRGVFRQQCRARGGADREPPRAAATFQHLGEKKQHKAGRDQQGRIRRYDKRADRRHQGDVQKYGGIGRDALTAEQDFGRAIDGVAHRQREQDRHQSHAKLGIAGDHGAETDHERNARRMIVIAESEILRPDPVIGFVEGERRPGRSNQPQRHQRRHDQRCVADQPIVSKVHRLRQTNSPDIA